MQMGGVRHGDSREKDSHSVASYISAYVCDCTDGFSCMRGSFACQDGRAQGAVKNQHAWVDACNVAMHLAVPSGYHYQGTVQGGIELGVMILSL